jgi:hypothetical protein
MRRVLPIVAVVFLGGTLLLLVIQAVLSRNVEAEITSHQGEPAFLEADDWEIDPAVQQAEIWELREARGSLLAGTSLANAQSDDEFGVALAQYTGGPALPAPTSRVEDTISFLRRTSKELDDRAHRYDEQREYEMADELRRCAKAIRKSIRAIEQDNPELCDFFSPENVRRSPRSLSEYCDEPETQLRPDRNDRDSRTP